MPLNQKWEEEFKNQVLFQGHNLIDLFNMTKHANGQDWWIVFSDIATSTIKNELFILFIWGKTLLM